MEYWLNWPWKEAFFASTFLIGTITSLLLLITKYPASRYLGVLIIAQLFFAFAIGFSPLNHLRWLSMALVSMALWLYGNQFFEQKTRIPKISLLPLIIIGFFTFIPFFAQYHLLNRIVTSLFVLGYIIFTINKIVETGQSRGISWFQNPGSRLAWFRNFLVINITLLFIWVVAFNWLTLTYALIGSVLQLLFIYIQIIRESTFMAPIVLGNKYQKSTLTAYQKHAISNKLDALLKTNKFYLDDNVSLGKVAEQLNTTVHHLSQVINETKGISFQKLIGQFRIKEAKRLLRNPENEQTTIENIATMVGYNSKSAFNTAFKKHTHLTPTAFRESESVRSYRETHLPDPQSRYFSTLNVTSNHVLSLNRITDMVSNFFKIFGRTQAKNKVFSLINLFGLTIGFACIIFIYLFISDELSFDKELPDSNNIYRIAWMNENPQTRTPHPMAQAFSASFPEVEVATSISPWYGAGLNKQTIKVKNENKDVTFQEPNFFFADSTFFDVFQLEIIAGDKNALKKPWNFVITDEMAIKYFGSVDAVGKELVVDEMPLVVNTVVKSMPKNSHFHFHALIPYVSLKQINPDNPWFKWEDFGHFNYFKTKPNTNMDELEAQIPDWIIPYLDWEESWEKSLQAGTIKFEFQPISDIHLNSHIRWELENNGNILYVYILVFTLFFILLIITINYINLTTAKSLDRAKEVGIRKTLGAMPQNLKLQFYLESFMTCFVALLLALVLSALFLDDFNQLAQKSFNYADIFEMSFLLKAMVATTIISLMSGYYPAFQLSAFNPAHVLKGQFSKSNKGRRLRSALVILQFFVSTVLITSSIIILNQINFMKTTEIGFDKEAIISIKVNESVKLGGIDTIQLKTLENQFKSLSGVKSTSSLSNLPGEQFNQNPIYLESDPSNTVDASEWYIDFNLIDVLNYEIIAGRDFNQSYGADINGINYLLNETAIKQLNLKNPIGKAVVWDNTWKNKTGTIIGVVKDFNFESLHENIQPLIIRIDPQSINYLVAKLDGHSFQNTLGQMKNIYNSVEKDLAFEYHFLDQQMAQMYNNEIRTLNIFATFAGIGLFLACLGLLGMAIAILNQRLKEVSIRKILGATAMQIMKMIMGQFTKLIIVAMVLGIPTGYFLMQIWLNEFSYKSPLGIIPFLIAAAALLGIALSSVSVVVLRIAFTNPVDALRQE